MRLYKNFLVLFFAFGLFGTNFASAEETNPELPTVEQIRQLYNELSGEWPKIPDTVLLLAQEAQDKNFFLNPPEISTITVILGQRFSPELPESLQDYRTQMSVTIAETLTHEEILLWFVNTIDLGQNCRGFPNAGMAYFGKSVEDLTIAEIAYFSVIIGSPVKYNPVTGYDDAIKRRNFFLMRMLAEDGTIPEEVAQAAADTEISARTPLGTCS